MTPGLLVLAIHLLLCLLGILFFLVKTKSPAQTMAAALIMVAFPLGGIIFIFVFFAPALINWRRTKALLPLPEIVTKGEGNDFIFIKPLNLEEEMNLTPLEEALVLSDKAERRRAILNILKKEIADYTTFINRALENDDSETTHYAAAGLLHHKRKLDLRMGEAKALYEKNADDPGVATGYAVILEQYLKSTYLDQMMKDIYLRENIAVLERIVEHKLDADIAHPIRLISLLLERADYEKVAHYNQLLLRDYPETEEKYIALLKSYFIMRDKSSFEAIFRQFKASDIVFSHDVLGLVRFWTGGAGYESN